MTPDGDLVTAAHLDAVRGEMHARIDQHRAEVQGTLKELTAKLDASREAQAREYTAVRGAVDKLTSEISRVGKAVGRIEADDGRDDAVREALTAFTSKWARRLYGTATLVVAAIAAFGFFGH